MNYSYARKIQHIFETRDLYTEDPGKIEGHVVLHNIVPVFNRDDGYVRFEGYLDRWVVITKEEHDILLKDFPLPYD
jgi:hypothetical protein